MGNPHQQIGGIGGWAKVRTKASMSSRDARAVFVNEVFLAFG